ncbi:MAG: BatA domain-containing protein [Cytophagales bacterium]|nr:BatA domain-containing protein [Cytophagales bacterium]MDW8383811.1 BatA domain-containing protein [Flammeovirgaceae bacterium]
MSFLFPSVLWALFLVSIPIIIHFFNFQKPKKIYFTQVALLQSVKQIAHAKNKLRHWLLLLCRIAAIVFLVLAFAQPVIPLYSFQTKWSNYVSVYLDNSYSMQNEINGKRLFDIAKSYADQIGTLFPKNVQFQLVDNAFEGTSNPMSADQLQNKISKIEMSAISQPIQKIYQKQKQLLEQVGSTKGSHIFILSDFQKSSIGELQYLAEDSSHVIYLLPFTNNQTENLSIDSVWLDEPFIIPKESQYLYCKVHNHGNNLVENINIRLIINQKQQASAVIEKIAAQSTETFKFSFVVSDSQRILPCRISLDDFPITFDNDYYFILRVAPNIKIVEISTASDSSPSYVEYVFSNESFLSFFKIKTEIPDYSTISEADLIVLRNLQDIHTGILQTLQKAFAQGTSIVIFPHEKANTVSYNQLFGGLSMQLKELPSDGRLFEYKLALEPPDVKNPFFHGVFEKIPQNLNVPSAVQTFAWSSHIGQTLLKFKNQEPFLSMFPQPNGGKLFLFASPLKPAYTDIGTHALFLPVMYRIAFVSKQQIEELAYRFEGGTAVFQIDSLQKNDILHLINENANYIPPQRITDNRAYISIPKGGLPSGTYSICTKKNSVPIDFIALNYSREESDIRGLTYKELKEMFANVPHIKVFDPQDLQTFKNDFKSQTEAIPLWRWMLILALIALLGETFLIRSLRYSKENKPTTVLN